MKRRIFRITLAIAAAAAMCLGASSCKKKESPTFHAPVADDPGEKTGAFDVEVGKALPAWEEGVLDIHAVNSGRGECTFFIMPDGTTLVVDAGDMFGYKNASYDNVPARPNSTAIPYETYAKYMLNFLPTGHNNLDYLLVTHYHGDHVGNMSSGTRTKDAEGGYILAGVTGLYSQLPFKTIIDRSYPDYSQTAMTSDVTKMDFYTSFIDYNVKNRGLKAEKFKIGTDQQIVSNYKKNGSYPDWKVFGYARGGVYWDGSAEINKNMTAENAMSCAFLLSYGKFDYFTSGDLNNNNVCSPVAQQIGKRIEAEKCQHHMSNASPYGVEYDVYQAQVVVTQSFYVRTVQPEQAIIKGYAATQDMFFTNIDDSLTSASPDIYNPCKGINGHVVIRVASGGDKFYVYMLDDTDYEYKVKSIHGPYTCY